MEAGNRLFAAVCTIAGFGSRITTFFKPDLSSWETNRNVSHLDCRLRSALRLGGVAVLDRLVAHWAVTASGRADAAKLDAYECGEPAVGTSFVQFDLRFYVVALVFIVFEVEVALFFPPATIFGTATRWMKPTPARASAVWKPTSA